MATKAAPAAAAAPATAPAAGDAAAPEDVKPTRWTKKRLLIAGGAAALVLLLLVIGGSVWWMNKQKAAAAQSDEFGDEPIEAVEPAALEEEEDPEHKAEARKKRADGKQTPVFLPLEVFTVNLADREAERYAQVGITLELSDAKVGDVLKAYMPAVRNDILMLLASKKAGELQERAGKLALAREIRKAALKPLGEDETDAAEDSSVPAVHFSSFIIQ